jgi:hypothetical protein
MVPIQKAAEEVAKGGVTPHVPALRGILAGFGLIRFFF